MANCIDTSYTLNYTSQSKGTISIAKSSLVTDEVDIALVGKTRLEYGEIFNENIVHLLENFACPENASNPGNPDVTRAFGTLLENPTIGQIWYNDTQDKPFVWDGSAWVGIMTRDDVAGNYGVIANSQSLPRPVSEISGYIFPYSECSWIVTPFNYTDSVDNMECYTTDDGEVTMRYQENGSAIWISGFANYQIIGVKGNDFSDTSGSGERLP